MLLEVFGWWFDPFWYGITELKNDGHCLVLSFSWLVVSFFFVHSYLGKIPMLTNIFSDGSKAPTSFLLEAI